MIFIRIAAIALLAACIQTALSAESTKKSKKVEQIQTVVYHVNQRYAAFLELCEQPHVKNGLSNLSALSKREKVVLFMELFPVVNNNQALDFIDIAQDIKKIKKAVKKAEKLQLSEQQVYLQRAADYIKLFETFARKYAGSYKFMYAAAKMSIIARQELPLFKDELEVAPAKTIALAHQKNHKAKFPILDYVYQLDHDLARLYKIQKRSLKDGVRQYVKNATIQGELLQNEIIKTSDYAMESRMRELAHPGKPHTGLKVIGGVAVAYFAFIMSMLIGSLVLHFTGAHEIQLL